MSNELYLLLVSAASIGFVHTLLGPDHYIPFIALAKAGDWSKKKLLLVTSLCGVGHVLSSILLGLFGVWLGTTLFTLENIESIRGDIAGWFLIIFGILYAIYGLTFKDKRATKTKHHKHTHKHLFIKHKSLEDIKDNNNNTVWILFLIFVFGPCEPLIPLLIYPAAQNSLYGVFVVSFVFSLVTISTMLVIVLIGVSGLELIPFTKMQSYMHSIAGFVIFLCGISVQFLNL